MIDIRDKAYLLSQLNPEPNKKPQKPHHVNLLEYQTDQRENLLHLRKYPISTDFDQSGQ